MLVASPGTVADKTVSFRPFAGQSFTIVGSEHDAGIVGELERSVGQYQREMASLPRRHADLTNLGLECSDLRDFDAPEKTLPRFRPGTSRERNPLALPRFGGADSRRLFARMRSLFPQVARIGAGGELVPLLGDGHL